MRLARLRRLRERALLTQEQLAQRAGVAKSTVNRLEQGKQEAQISTVRRLAEALGATAAELIGDEQVEMDIVEASDVARQDCGS